ncbi:alpha-N-acetylgalactosaminidase isoform X2 [Neodiprion fabricii]|uniref:alpha-N-acetylgalactosaminidase isoform X2 n=2 Tax=Neodiprion fabricii TaxID=2872261 RepID=UPI001ED8E3A2|nr:alpha-N-acetylgalactosaminidase isoform X2 [Neodiprion fabricii]
MVGIAGVIRLRSQLLCSQAVSLGLVNSNIINERMVQTVWIWCAVVLIAKFTAGLENGLVRTPPMGWLSWERFRCNTDCKNDPDNCIRDGLFRTMTDIVIAEGYAAVGYQYINIDDCWLERERGFDGQLKPDRQRFPYGIKNLADYVHSKGLKFGIYEDYGNYTCGGYPGILGHLEEDAALIASWDVDYIKLDGCYAHPSDMDKGYSEFGYYLNRTGRPMVYSCSWPVYQTFAGMKPNFSLISDTCNLWRNFGDIQDSWASIESIMDYFGDNQDDIAPNAGPGHWNDPDMLIVGNFGLSYEQSKTQMALWAILAAPLFMSVDLRTIRPEYKAILQNKKIIAVDQDPLGIQGRRIYKHKGIEIWARPISPTYQNYYSYAIAFINRRTDGTPSDVSVTLKELGLAYPAGYRVEDLYEDVDYGILTPQTKIKVKVNPSGVVILRADVDLEAVYAQNNYTPFPVLNQVFKVNQNTFK